MPRTIDYLAEDSIRAESYDFLEVSKLHEYTIAPYSERLGTIMNTPYFMEQVMHHTPEWGFCESFPLEMAINNTKAAALYTLGEQRQSHRQYNRNLTFTELSTLLALSYRETASKSTTSFGPQPARTIASGGGLYPVDIYLINQSVEGLPAGVYYYNLHNCSLDRIREYSPESLRAGIERAFMPAYKNDMDYQQASAYLVFAASLQRVCFKYQDRGIRFAMLDAGALMHGTYLATTALCIGCCGIGGYIDDYVAELIGLTNQDQYVMGVLLIGGL